MPSPSLKTIAEALAAQALRLGATATGTLLPRELVIDSRFPELCAGPTRCPSYGLAPGCPPHATAPQVFAKQLDQYQVVLVFKIDAPMSHLMGPERLPLARLTHCIAANLETTALQSGIQHAQGMAAGSCRELFCAEEPDCPVLARHLPCRHPNLARDSISAVGVDFTALTERLGWSFKPFTPEKTADPSSMGFMAGLVLLG